MSENRKGRPTRAYTVHRGQGHPPDVARVVSDGARYTVTYGKLSEAEKGWLSEYLPDMHGEAAEWGTAEKSMRPGGPVGPVRVTMDD